MCIFCCMFLRQLLTFILLTWRIRWTPNNTSKWQMGFNSAFKGLILFRDILNLNLSVTSQLKPDYIIILCEETSICTAICTLLGCYSACCGNFLPTFWGNLSFPPSSVKKSKLSAGVICVAAEAWNHDFAPRRSRCLPEFSILWIQLWLSLDASSPLCFMQIKRGRYVKTQLSLL